MLHRTSLLLLAPTLLFLGCIARVGDQATSNAFQDQETPPMAELSPKERQERVMRSMMLGKPGPEHEELGKLAGEWKSTLKTWMTPGAQEPMKIESEASIESVMGGRYLRFYSRTKFMGIETESLSFLGFDRRHEEYTVVGFDTMGTYWVSAQGPYDAERGAIVMSGTDEDPVLGHTQVYEMVLTRKDADRFSFAIVFLDQSHGNEGPFKMVEIDYERKTQ